MKDVDIPTLIRMVRLRSMGMLDDAEVEEALSQMESPYERRLAKSLIEEKPTKSVRGDYHMIRQFAGVEDGSEES